MKADEGTPRDFTVAQVRFTENSNEAQVLFLESPRIYRLLRTHAQFDSLLTFLELAKVGGKHVMITTGGSDGDLLESVAETRDRNTSSAGTGSP